MSSAISKHFPAAFERTIEREFVGEFQAAAGGQTEADARNFPFFASFDGYIFSHEIGGLKPQPKIYAAMESMTGKRGADLVYIDDRPENVAAGAARGWRAILHETPGKTRAFLDHFLS